jgi:hypothetical protein
VEIIRAAFVTIPHSEMFCLVGALFGGGNLLLKDFQAYTPWKYFHKYLGFSLLLSSLHVCQELTLDFSKTAIS